MLATNASHCDDTPAQHTTHLVKLAEKAVEENDDLLRGHILRTGATKGFSTLLDAAARLKVQWVCGPHLAGVREPNDVQEEDDDAFMALGKVCNLRRQAGRGRAGVPGPTHWQAARHSVRTGTLCTGLLRAWHQQYGVAHRVHTQYLCCVCGQCRHTEAPAPSPQSAPRCRPRS